MLVPKPQCYKTDCPIAGIIDVDRARRDADLESNLVLLTCSSYLPTTVVSPMAGGMCPDEKCITLTRGLVDIVAGPMIFAGEIPRIISNPLISSLWAFQGK